MSPAASSKPYFPSATIVGGALSLALVFELSCSPCEPIAPLRADPVPPQVAAAPLPEQKPAPVGPTAEEARTFIDQTETQLRGLWSYRERLSYLANTYITSDTEWLVAQADEQAMDFESKKIAAASRFDHVTLPPELRRKFDNLKHSQVLAAPPIAAERQELAQIAAKMEGHYGKAQYCPTRLQNQAPGQPKCLKLDDLERVLQKSKNYDEQLDAWTGWHEQAKPLKPDYVRYVSLANKGARAGGYADTGAMWRAKYDMPPDAFAQDVERLWSEVEPLYKALHCYTRMKLHAQYGARVPETGPIPAHLLGNMWAQEWGNLFSQLAPAGKGRGLDIGAALKAKKTTPQGLVKYGENFFTSLGLDPLPETFWQRSMFVRPRDRDVVCHASAWDLTNRGDLRLKMCIELDEENFRTVHHELGHIYYYWAYRDMPILFQSGANDGFHEGIGDTIALSITPAYLKKIGLVDPAAGPIGETPADDLAFLLRDALDRVAFLPFGKLIDQWRWDVFSEKVKPEEFNKAWWDLRLRYQGIAPATPRGEEFFDPGAKFHIPANTPYMRYFLAHILQFQFHRALCQAAGHTGPLYKCSIYGNRAAGDKLKAMLALGASKPWQEALRAIAGTDQIDASALLEYYQPLATWLQDQTKTQKCGW